MLFAAGLIVAACGDDDQDAVPGYDSVDEASAGFDYDIVIPAGTQDRIDAGENVQLVPGEWVVTVGETVRIRNDDEDIHSVGPFSLGPGETLTQRFASEGTYGGWCTVHPSGQITLEVEAADA